MEYGKTALVLGATGLVGGFLVKELIANPAYTKIKIFTRRSTNLQHPKIEEVIMDFDHMEMVKESVEGDVLFSAFGTTRNKAGSKEAQYKVDYTYQYNFARLAARQGVDHYVLVSSSGADSSSSFFYLKMRGELEDAVKQLPFEKVYILQPSVLMGNRDENRLGEEIGAKVFNALSFIPAIEKRRPIHGKVVAKAMVNILKMYTTDKVYVSTLNDLFDLAEGPKQ
ncbi:NAD(P)H-binding protein [Algivirga pacifica]|uniref:Oxidoreductase n=1 Tax=Algivirga pacifica TaxID=1162670 RepID=A0ABP9D7W6_9BACT